MANDQGQAHKLAVFISYSRDDIGFADQLDAVQLHGYATTLDRHGISGREDWKHRLGNLIRDADTVVFVLSPSSARSEICAWEVAKAGRLGKRILPVVCRPLENTTPPQQLANLNYVFFYDEPKSPGSGFGTGQMLLVTALNTDLDWLREHCAFCYTPVSGTLADGLPTGYCPAPTLPPPKRGPRAGPKMRRSRRGYISTSSRRARPGKSSSRANGKNSWRSAKLWFARQRATGAAREAAQRQATESAQREAAQAKRVARRTLAGLTAAMLLALVAGGTGIYARTQQLRAESERQSAEQEKQRAESEKKRAENEKTAVDGLIQQIKIGRGNGPGITAMKKICGEAIDVTSSLAGTTDAGVFANRAGRFWELYYGELNLIEMRQKTSTYAGNPNDIANSRIESAMVQFGNGLRAAPSTAAALPQRPLFALSADVKIECDAFLR